MTKTNACNRIINTVYVALKSAQDPKGLAGKKISPAETRKILAAMNNAGKFAAQALKQQKISDTDAFEEIPGTIGLNVMRSIKKSDFVKKADFMKVWRLAGDYAGALPDIGNYIPD